MAWIVDQVLADFADASRPDTGPSARAGAVLTIDLGAIVANWRGLAQRVRPSECAAVVKADAYGLGAARIAPALARAGCRHFFVAHVDEGIALRAALGRGSDGRGPAIHVLHGPPPGTEPVFAQHCLLPVLNSAEQVAGWTLHAARAGGRLPAALQVDTGMARLGVAEAELGRLAQCPALDLRLVMSHLACADTPAHPANAAQLAAFRRVRALWPGVPASLAASSGIFLGPGFHCDLVRPGAALYGIAPRAGANPMRPVLRLQARIVQVRSIAGGEAVGYGHSWRAPASTRIATIGLGYADGLPRSLSGRGCAWLGEHCLPFVGRVSMDSVTLDVSGVPEELTAAGAWVDLIGPRCMLDDVAAAAGTIGYEVLTGLGRRLHRCYYDGPGEPA